MFASAPPPSPRVRRSTGERLRAALTELADGHATIVTHSERSWASITFAGARHRVTLAFAVDAGIAAGERFIADLPDHEFAVPGHLVADATIVEVHHQRDPAVMQVTCEMLLLEDA